MLLVTAAVILVAACIRKRRENDDEASCEDGETDNSDRNAGDRNVNEMGNLAVIIDALGGMDNIYNLACSDTRLRVTVNEPYEAQVVRCAWGSGKGETGSGVL